MLKHWKSNLSLSEQFGKSPIPLDFTSILYEAPKCEQKILRMLVKTPETNLLLPPSLQWLLPLVERCSKYQQLLSTYYDRYIYITVRHGLVDFKTDDEWHVDGFSTRIPHVPEQNYIVCSAYPTQFAIANINIPRDFNPLLHNIQYYLQDFLRENLSNCLYAMPNRVYLIDPYVVHRRDPEAYNKFRTFVRVSFVPIEIQDDTCTCNPLMPLKKYNTKDFRTDLMRYNYANHT